MKRDGLVVRPGVIELIDQARANGVKVGYVPTSPLSNIMSMFDNMKGLNADSFDFWMSKDNEPEYGRNKPAPDCYLYACRKFGVRTPLVFEDSEVSMNAPLGANLDVIAIPNNWCQGHDYSKALATVNEPIQLLKKEGLNQEEAKQLA